jgi:GT2 family glycosyltransferase
MKQAAAMAIFVYKRPEHARRMLRSVLQNPLALHSPMHIFCDGPRGEHEAGAVAQARAAVRELAPAHARVVEHERNLGLAGSVVAGVTEVTREHGEAIIIEDDLELSPFALEYFNAGLRRYRDEERVMHLAGYMYPVRKALPEAFFCREATCYGWATWARAWRHFEPDGRKIRDAVNQRGARREFDVGGSIDFFAMLEAQIAGRTDSWAIRWYGSLWLRGGLALHPGRSLVRNTGFDGSGENSGASETWAVELSADPVTRFPSVIEEDALAVRAMMDYRRRAARQRRLESLQRTLRTFRRWVS